MEKMEGRERRKRNRMLDKKALFEMNKFTGGINYFMVHIPFPVVKLVAVRLDLKHEWDRIKI